MGSISLLDVQKLLHLNVDYPQFKSYELPFEFNVEGILISAIAFVQWRSILIKIIEPYEITAWDFQPPLFALGVMMLHRKEIQQRDGKTDLDEFISRTKDAYISHRTYLRLKPEIDAAQAPVLNKHRAELHRLQSVHESVREHVSIRKNELRQQFKAGLITQKPYQNELQELKKEESDARCAHTNLERKIEMKLDEIKNLMIDQALSKEMPPAEIDPV